MMIFRFDDNEFMILLLNTYIYLKLIDVITTIYGRNIPYLIEGNPMGFWYVFIGSILSIIFIFYIKNKFVVDRHFHERFGKLEVTLFIILLFFILYVDINNIVLIIKIGRASCRERV